MPEPIVSRLIHNHSMTNYATTGPVEGCQACVTLIRLEGATR